ncbi:MAG: hypothetical protein JOZ96_25605, partial [Acidobacteria bacterium]|nr:hypothetical protein [Acidobacteriota bacterium]
MTTLDLRNTQKLLKEFKFTELFTQELGWDRLRLPPRALPVDGTSFTLMPVAEKRGFQVFECRSSNGIPSRTIRTKIDREVTMLAYEHLIVFVDGERTTQIWRWEQREEGQPRIAREESFVPAQQVGKRMAHKLSQLFISLQEEEAGGLSVAGISSRVRSAFNVERVTKRFYDQFKKEHDAFLKQIVGIEDAEQKSWYASLMLNRLMFIYFLQRKGFLNGDRNYLRNRLTLMQERYGKDKFYSFYNTFLRRLFHDGLGKPERNPEIEFLLGKVPYLNGGLF